MGEHLLAGISLISRLPAPLFVLLQMTVAEVDG
jgi:hypothetical protein